MARGDGHRAEAEASRWRVARILLSEATAARQLVWQGERVSPRDARVPPLPKRIGRYEILHALGSGGMARVYLAVQRGTVAAKLVVVKCMRETLARDPAFVRMFVDESRVAVRMNHPNVIHTYEADRDGDEYFIAMEFLEGKTLAHLLASTSGVQLPLGLHLWVLCEVLNGLAYAHDVADFDGTSLGIVHRDVSPSNVFVTRTGSVKLVDFGVAKIIGGALETRQGPVKGKLGYAAPEQCLDGVVDARSDIYSVGVMLWEAIAGRPRAGGDTAMATIQARVLDMEPDIAQVCPEVPPELAEIVRRALALDPSLRYQTAAEFRADLQRHLIQTGAVHGERALASLIVKHFEEEMTHLRRAIDAKVRVSIAAPSAPPTPPPLDGGSDSPALPNLDSLASGLVRAGASFHPAKSRAWLLYALIALAAAATLVGILTQRTAVEANVRPRPSAIAPPPANNVASEVRSTPSAAPVVASGSGEPASLTSASPPSAPEAVPAPAIQPRSHTTASQSGNTPMASSATLSLPAAPRIEPGADLHTQSGPLGVDRQKRALDERDPYLSH